VTALSAQGERLAYACAGDVYHMAAESTASELISDVDAAVVVFLLL
jgi:hypothetical protein